MTPRKVAFGTQLPPQLVAEVRKVVLDLQRTDPSMTISRFTAEALTKALAELPAPADAPVDQAPRPGRRIAER